MKKRILLVLVLVMGILSMPWVVNADDGGYYFDQYHFKGIVNQDGSMDVTIDLKVHFNEPRHGIYYELPEEIKMSRELNGKMEDYYYQVDIENVEVKGAPYEVEDSQIIIGDEDRLVNGDVYYQISYRYVFGDDRYEVNDDLFYTMLGDGWNTTINQANFEMSFVEKVDLKQCHIYWGEYGSKNENGIKIDIKDNTITASVSNLRPHESVSLYQPLPQGYFSEVSKASMDLLNYFSIGFIAICLIGIIRFVIIYLKYRRENQEEIPCNTPPDNLSSADIGYVMDGDIDMNDLKSLTVWFAAHEYISFESINANESKPVKLKDLESYYPKHMHNIFDALCSENDKDYGKRMENAYQLANKHLKEYYRGERALVKPLGRVVNIILIVLICMMQALTLIATIYNASMIPTIMFAIISSLAALIISIILQGTFVKCNMKSTGKKIARIVCLIVVIVIEGVMLFFSGVGMKQYIILCIILGNLALLCVENTNVYSDYKMELVKQIRGFKTYIVQCRLDQIIEQYHQNPKYFADVLPYAYVFGYSDQWIEKNKDLDIYQNDNYYNRHNMFLGLYLMSHCNRSMRHSDVKINEYHASQASSSSTHSSGGFSGGGFGGGGGGSW